MRDYWDDKPKEECAIFGIFGQEDAVQYTTLGLHAMQHRGQDSTGIVTYDDATGFHSHRALDLVGRTFTNANVVNALIGNHAIGHNRYSTTGDKEMRNIQPLYADLDSGGAVIAHNGNLTNAKLLRHELVESGSIFQTSTDSEIFLHLMASYKGSVKDKLQYAASKTEGAFSLLCLTKDALIGYRDPIGIRPLALGKLNNSYVLASETVAFDIMGAEYIRPVRPGEMIIITENNYVSYQTTPIIKPRTCLFEYVYFARPDGEIDGINVYDARRKIGENLAKEHPVDADIVVPIPDSGTPAALGYAKQSGITLELGIIRNQYKARTFIEPEQHIRHLGVLLKHNANKTVLKNKRVILVDDSVVRGTTSRKIVDMVLEAGAKEVHLRIASPPVLYPCYYGIDLADKGDLIACRFRDDLDAMGKYLSASSIRFLSLNGLYNAICGEDRNNDNPQFTDHYFTGHYPTKLSDRKISNIHQPSLIHNL